MSDKTGIEWTDATWNPTKGCDRVSAGCDHCYAMTLAPRLKAMGSPAYQLDGDPRTSGPGFLSHEWPAVLDQPIRWTKPRLIFVNSMSDLFHDNISDEYIARVFAVMWRADQHTFQILTKRHARMRSLLSSERFHDMLVGEASTYTRGANPGLPWPLPNVWLGVSVENQQWASIRIPALLDTPAAVRFLSCEPLLGPVDLSRIDWTDALHWVIAGGESGQGARPMHLDWARALRDQCADGGIPFLFKQWGEWAPGQGLSTGSLSDPREQYGEIVDDGKYPELTWRRVYRRVGKKAAGRTLDGRTWDEYPQAVTA